MKRAYFTLIELVIALTLTSVLMLLLTFFYRDLTTVDAHSEKIQRENFLLRYAENRLAQIIPETLDGYQSKGNPLFFTVQENSLSLPSAPHLIFLYDNHANLNPDLSSTVLGRLYIDQEHRLCLATWPFYMKKTPFELGEDFQKEVLLENVETLSYEFFVPPDRDRQIVQKNLSYQEDEGEQQKPENAGQTSEEPLSLPGNAWTTSWKREYKMIPGMIKLHITLKADSSHKEAHGITFAFPLPNSKKVIIYDEGGA